MPDGAITATRSDVGENRAAAVSRRFARNKTSTTTEQNRVLSNQARLQLLSRAGGRVFDSQACRSVSKRRNPPLFELGKYWLAVEKGRPGYYCFWYEPRTRRVRRARCASETLEEAKLELAEIVVKGSLRNIDDHLAPVLETYFLERTDKRPSKKPARRAAALLLEFFEAELATKTPRVFAFDEKCQAQFIAWAARQHAHSVKTISRNMSVVAAAIAHAKIKDFDVAYAPTKIEEILDAQAAPIKGEERRFIPTDEELARFLDHVDGAAFRACLIMLNTGCRPEAALDLAPAQRNAEAGLVQLNPDGRRQTRKWRPVVRETICLEAWLNAWDHERGDADEAVKAAAYVGLAAVDSLQSAITRARAKEKANLPRLVGYSIRHKMATVLRRYAVPEDQIAMQLGHRRPALRTTGLYGEYEPSYLKAASDALDAFMIRVQGMTKRRLFAPTLLPQNEHSVHALKPKPLKRNGGRDRDRTCDPYDVNVVLSR